MTTADQTLGRQLALSACVRDASFRTPLIRASAAKAAHGPAASARYHLGEAVRHTKELLATLERQQVALGWSDDGSPPPISDNGVSNAK